MRSWLRSFASPRCAFAVAVALASATAGAARAQAVDSTPRARPSVASINVCADQLVLMLADPEQVRTVSWLSADPEESLLAEEAAKHPLNYGTAEELLRFAPEVVIAGSFTNAFTRSLLARLGYRVVELVPETSVDEIAANVRRVAAAIDRAPRGEALVARMRANEERLRAARSARPVRAVLVRPGGFTVGEHSLADELMRLAGLRNVAAEQGLDRWGSLSMETLLLAAPELVVLTGYRAAEPSLANAVLAHPALRAVRESRKTVTIGAAYWSCGLPQSLDVVERLEQAVR